jgi:hypothetical protein
VRCPQELLEARSRGSDDADGGGKRSKSGCSETGPERDGPNVPEADAMNPAPPGSPRATPAVVRLPSGVIWILWRQLLAG